MSCINVRALAREEPFLSSSLYLSLVSAMLSSEVSSCAQLLSFIHNLFPLMHVLVTLKVQFTVKALAAEAYFILVVHIYSILLALIRQFSLIPSPCISHFFRRHVT